MMAEDNIIPLDAWKGRIQQSRQGPKKNVTNLMLHLRNIKSLGSKLAYNDLSGNIEWNGREIKDSDYVDIRLTLEQNDFEPNAKDVPACVLRTAEDHTYNPVVDYLEGLTWDGRERLSEWLPRAFSADDTEINRAFGRMFLISAVARALQPGCQVDTMLIAKGEQGTRKTTAFRELFGEQFVSGSITKFSGPDVGMSLQGIWAVDLGELEALSASVQTIKNFISLRNDRYRPVWGRHFINRPRRIVFTGNTNEDAFLRDPTGARRFWPFEAGAVDIDLIKRNRDQLWAESVRAFKDGEKWWIERGDRLDGLAIEVQRLSYKEDVWAPKIDQIITSPEAKLRGCLTVDEVLTSLSIATERQDDRVEERIISHLKHRGWWKRRCLRHGENRNWWFPPDSDETFRMGRPRGG